MGVCGRCSVSSMVRKYGADNVVEIVVPSTFWNEYKLFRVNETHGKFLFEEKKWTWVMSVHSMEHSLDEDCDYCYACKVGKNGYPRQVDASCFVPVKFDVVFTKLRKMSSLANKNNNGFEVKIETRDHSLVDTIYWRNSNPVQIPNKRVFSGTIHFNFDGSFVVESLDD